MTSRPWHTAPAPARHAANDNTPGKARTQTVRMGGKRVKIKTSATGRVTVADALPLEWELQAEQVKMLRRLPGYGPRFLLAGDQNAAKRGPKAQAQAVASGMTAGEPDVRIYLRDGQVKHIENKVTGNGLSAAQVKRHAELTALGHEVVVVTSSTPEDAAAQAVAIVQAWLREKK
jgi:hypothetical protein